MAEKVEKTKKAKSVVRDAGSAQLAESGLVPAVAAGDASAEARTPRKNTLKVKMIGSVIGCPDKQRATVRGLGLRRLHQVVERQDTPEIRGMVKKVPHLVSIVK
jgi:large subunit ribosomal protein L30